MERRGANPTRVADGGSKDYSRKSHAFPFSHYAKCHLLFAAHRRTRRAPSVKMERVRKSMRSGLRLVGNAAVGLGGGSVALVSTALPESGGAVDLIAVRQPDGSLRCSPWHVRFGKYQGLLRATEKVVTITVNGEPVPDVTMRLGRSGVAYFVDKDVDQPSTPTGGDEIENEISTDPNAKHAPGALDDSLAPEDESGESENDETDLDTSRDVESDTNIGNQSDQTRKDVDTSIAVARLQHLDDDANASDSDVQLEYLRPRVRQMDMTGSTSDDGSGVRDIPSTSVSLGALGLDTDSNLTRSKSCGDFLGVSGDVEEMTAARAEAPRRTATEGVTGEVDVLKSVTTTRRGSKKSKSKQKRKRKKRFQMTADEIILMKDKLTPGKNLVAFQFQSSVWGKQTVRAHLYQWNWNARVVISDVDGTITKSDVLGHLAPMVGKDWNHAGITKLYNRIKSNGFELLFLSSRAVSQSAVTRRYLQKLTQDGETLTHGPVLLAPDSISAALYREVVIRQPQVFKMECLANIKSLFPHGGEGGEGEKNNEEDTSYKNPSPFYAGFGNRPTDAASYASVGVPPDQIFTINPQSLIVAESTKGTNANWDLGEMISLADSMFPCESAGTGGIQPGSNGDGEPFAQEEDVSSNGQWIGGVPIDEAFIDSNYWGRGDAGLGEALP